MMRWRWRWCFFFFIIASVLRRRGFSAAIEEEGTAAAALLRFRDRVELDPYGALSGWIENGAAGPCSWTGVGCSGAAGVVTSLTLSDLGLKGTLAPELAKLVHLKHLILHNNSFYGTIPREIAELLTLEVLDLGHNDFSGSIPSELFSIFSLEILKLGGNNFTASGSSKLRGDEDLLSSSSIRYSPNAAKRRIMQLISSKEDDILSIFGRNPADTSTSHLIPSSAPSPIHLSPTPSDHHPIAPSPESASPIPQPHPKNSTEERTSTWVVYASMAGGASSFIALSAFCCCFFRGNRLVTVRPLSSSGRMQKAPVAAGGMLALRRSELVTACEGFSNVVGNLADCTLYKGTLPSGVEIAVTSSMATRSKGWSKKLDSQFRKKVSALSQANHKNFLNLLGYCEDEKPFARMMVFEYAPNGTLFEHLHIKEAEHLDWPTRLRIIMGLACCLEHLHGLKEPHILHDLSSSTIFLTEDYAVKVSDLAFFHGGENDVSKAQEGELPDASTVEAPPPDKRTVTYKFGLVCLEILSGRRPFSEDYGLLVRWASSHLSGKRPLRDMIDPTLEGSVRVDQVGPMCEVIRSCIELSPRKRATMAEAAGRLRAVTAIVPEAAAPTKSPLLWAELQLLSMEAS